MLLAAVIAIELALVAINVLINQWNNRFYNALQDRNWDAFVSELLFFCVLAGAFIVLAVYQLYLNQWLQIRWRRWMTKRYLGDWLDGANHYRMQLLGDAADNPDQRIAEDIQLFVEQHARPSASACSARSSRSARSSSSCGGCRQRRRCTLFGSDWTYPRLSGLGRADLCDRSARCITHLIGRPLIGLNFNQQRYEADFRFNLVRVRENSEQIALLEGEPPKATGCSTASAAWSRTGCDHDAAPRS